MIKSLSAPLYYLVLRPLIKRNYKLRAEGVIPDKWYWADEVSIKLGYVGL